MRRIIIGNPTTDNTYRTNLSDDYADGLLTSVLSNVGFSQNDLGIFGEVGEEQTELKKIISLTNKDTLNLASELNFAHVKDTPVYKAPWDYMIIEARSSSAGVFATISESPIQWDKHDTIYYHIAGTNTWEYRFKFYNSVTGLYSEYSPTVTGAGFDRNQVGFMIGNVRKNIRDFDGRLITDNEIISCFNDAQHVIYARNPRYWFLKVNGFKADNGVAITNDQDVYSLANLPSFGHLDIVRFRYTQGGTDKIYTLNRNDNVDFAGFSGNLNALGNDQFKEYTVLPPDEDSVHGYVQFYPKVINNDVAIAYFDYYKNLSDLNSVDDATVVPLPDLLEKYAIAFAERLRGNEKKADQYEDLFYGPADMAQARQNLRGLPLLDQLDDAKKNSPSQPRSLFRFRGQRGVRKIFGNRYGGMNHDQIKERYF